MQEYEYDEEVRRQSTLDLELSKESLKPKNVAKKKNNPGNKS